MKCIRVGNTALYMDATSSYWNDGVFTAINMMPTPIGMQPNDYIINKWEDKPYGHLDRIGVMSVHDGEHIIFALQWVDEESTLGEDEGFPDGVVVAFPVRGEPHIFSMGSEDEPIHGLHWRARFNEIRSVVATGIGSSVDGPEMKLSVKTAWKDSVWRVVMSRELKTPEGAAPLAPGADTQIGFAVWNGANEERGGIKAVSPEWVELNIAP